METINKEIITKAKRRIALIVQYNGSGYSGWQRQPNNKTIQEVLEEAISIFETNTLVKTFAAGRTDAGVHAAGQVVHFDSVGNMPSSRWASALNGRLPKSIRIIKSTECPENWHACFSAISRKYRYTIYNGCSPNLFLENWSWHKYQYRLDEKLMHLAIDKLLGHHDFSAFERSGSRRKDAFTTIKDVLIKRNGDIVQIEIEASGFLYGMVRLLVGQLVALGEYKLKPKEFERRWRQQKREEVKESAPAKGLCFLHATYKEKFLYQDHQYCSFPNFLLETNDSPPQP